MYACFDIGGTAVKVAAIDATLELYDYAIFESKNDLAYLINIIEKNTQQFKEKYDIKGVCISIPGSVEPNSGVVYGVSALSCIHGFSWKEKLSSKLHLPIHIENDANCVALCELAFGKGKTNHDFLSLVIGTGVGASIVKNRKLHYGATLFGGEFGFMIVNGSKGTYETFSHKASVGSLVRKVRAQLHNDTMEGKDIFDKADANDEICKKAVDEFYQNVAVGIYNMRFMYDPEIIILSGAVSQRKDFVARIYTCLEQIMKEVTYSTFHVEMDITPFMPIIEVSKYSKDANLYGAMAGLLGELT